MQLTARLFLERVPGHTELVTCLKEWAGAAELYRCSDRKWFCRCTEFLGRAWRRVRIEQHAAVGSNCTVYKKSKECGHRLCLVIVSVIPRFVHGITVLFFECILFGWIVPDGFDFVVRLSHRNRKHCSPDRAAVAVVKAWPSSQNTGWLIPAVLLLTVK